MKLNLVLKSGSPSKLIIDIKQQPKPSEQINEFLRAKSHSFDDLKEIAFEYYTIDDFNQLDDWYYKLEHLVTYNQRRQKALMPDESFAINPVSTSEALKMFRDNYPKNRLWQLAVDGNLYAKTVGAIAGERNGGENGWVNYAIREPKSLEAFFPALEVALDNIEDKFISHDLILQLHDFVTKDVFFGYGNNGTERGAYRRHPPTFDLASSWMTVEGLTDLLNKMESGNFALVGEADSDGESQYLYSHLEDNEKIFLSHSTIFDTRNKIAEKYKIENNNSALAKFMIERCEKIRYQAPAAAEEVMEQIINNYNEQIKTLKEPDEILQLIGETTEAFERTHPFGDANGRTFVNLLQNRLLIQNGFPPATLFQPNLYDAFGNHVAVLKRGIQNTMAIYNGEDIFGYHMHILHPIHSKEATFISVISAQDYFDNNENLRNHALQVKENPLLSEQGDGLTLERIYNALSITDNLLLKLDYIDQALSKYEQDTNDIALLDRVYKELISTIPAPQYTQTPEDFALQELNLQIVRRVKEHARHPAIQRLLERHSLEVIKENAQNAPEIQKEKLDKDAIAKLQVQTVVDDSLQEAAELKIHESALEVEEKPLPASEFEAPELSKRTSDLIDILERYIKTREADLKAEVEASKHFKTKLFGFKFDSSAEEKIKAARHLIDLLEHKPDTKPLDDKEFSALTTSRLGNKTSNYIDLIERFYKPELGVHRSAKG